MRCDAGAAGVQRARASPLASLSSDAILTPLSARWHEFKAGARDQPRDAWTRHRPAYRRLFSGRWLPHSSSSSPERARAPPTMLSLYGQLFLVAAVAFTITAPPALGNATPRKLQDLYEDTPPLAAASGPSLSGEDYGDSPLSRRRRFWSNSESSEEEEQHQQEADGSGYAAAIDALMAYHAAVQRGGRREVAMPDMRRQTSQKLLFFTVTTRLSISQVRLRVPATLRRVSAVTAESLPDGGVDMSCDVLLGDFETWGQYDVKVNGVGPSGDFETTIRDRVVRATIRFRELPAVAAANSSTATTTTTAAPGHEAAAAGTTTAAAPLQERCSLEATELTLVERGRNDVPAVLARWASEVEDVPTTLQVMKELLNERLAQYHCGEDLVAMVRRGHAAPS